MFFTIFFISKPIVFYIKTKYKFYHLHILIINYLFIIYLIKNSFKNIL